MSKRFALLADVHGNGDALRAVLADLDERGGADRLLVLGDIVLLGPDPGEVVELLIARDSVGVYGNVDQFLLGADWHTFMPRNEEDEADRAVCLWALERIGEEAEAWLRSLPFQKELTVSSQRLLLVHGSPRSERDTIKVEPPNDEVREMILGSDADLILCGHTHESLDRTVESVRLINPGAVGIPQGEAGTALCLALLGGGMARRVSPCSLRCRKDDCSAVGGPATLSVLGCRHVAARYLRSTDDV